jgi:hypothetical protein
MEGWAWWFGCRGGSASSVSDAMISAGRTVAPGTWMVSASFAETEATKAAALEGAPAPARGYAGERYGPSACGLQLCL